MRVADLITAMERLAPLDLAESWDNVGLLVGSAGRVLDGPVLVCIDLTEAVVNEAAKQACRAIVAYHPPIFQPLKRVRSGAGETEKERIVHRVIEAGIAVYSPHTALDAADGGVTDWLSDGVMGHPSFNGKAAAGAGGKTAGGDRRALTPAAGIDVHQEVKIVTFVPAKEVELVRASLASAGAGLIGKYELCSFVSEGRGTFRGQAGTKPAVGVAESFETVEEVRLEMVCSRRALALALETLRQFHPYEEPAVDVYPLVPKPVRKIGAGRRITLDRPAKLRELALRLKDHLGVSFVQMGLGAGQDENTEFARIGLVPGAGGSLAPAALADGCEVFVTGEMKHHEVAAMTSAGMSILLGGHTPTERGYLPTLAQRLREQLKGVQVLVSSADRDPLQMV